MEEFTMSAEEYRQKINALGLGELKKMTISNQADAERVLKQVLTLQDSLDQIKRGVTLEIEKSSQYDAAPYQTLILKIDSFLTGLNRLKMQLEAYMKKPESDVEEKLGKEKSQPPPTHLKSPTHSPSQPQFETKEFCPHCGSVIAPSDKFCGSCGQRLCCPHCGSANSQSDKFCGSCGQRLYVF